MKVSEMRDLSIEEINAQIDEARKNSVDLRFQHALRKLESPAKLRLERRKLAQLLTILTEKQNANGKKAPAEGAEAKAPAKKAEAKKAPAKKAAEKKPAAKEKAKAE
jgi:large subunit ribosomal protein L29